MPDWTETAKSSAYKVLSCLDGVVPIELIIVNKHPPDLSTCYFITSIILFPNKHVCL